MFQNGLMIVELLYPGNGKTAYGGNYGKNERYVSPTRRILAFRSGFVLPP